MSELVKRLRDRRLNVWNEARELADKAAEENRAFSGEEEAKWQTLNGELDQLDKRIGSILEGEKRAADTEETFRKLYGQPVDPNQRQSANGPVGGATGREPGSGDPASQQRNTELRSFLRGKGEPTFQVMPRDGFDFRTATYLQQTDQVRSLSVGTTTAGGYTVPIDFYDRLVEHLIQVSAVLQAKPTVINTAGGEQIQVPKTTSHGAGSLIAEGASITAGSTDPAFGQVALHAYKYGAMVQISRELLEDTAVDLEGYIARSAGRNLGNAIGAHFVSGTGTGQPNGILTAATAGVTDTVAGGASLSSSDVVFDLFHSVIPPYRNSPSCYWMMNDQTLAAVRKLKDSQGRYLWEPSMQLGTADSLLAKPLVIDYNMPSLGSATTPIAFGDFSTYFVRFAGGIRLERSVEYAFDTDLVSFRAVLRGDGNLVDLTGSIKFLKTSA
jgi:HK97 family phage major capsid protein